MDFLKEYFEKLNKKQKTYLFVFLGVLVVLLWAFISAGIITHNFNRDVLKNASNNQELEVKGMILTESKDGQKSWEIYGETGDYSNDHKLATMNNIIGNFYKGENVNMSFQAIRGTYSEETRNIDLYEDILVVLENDITIVADHITYYSDTKTIKATGNVVINKRGAFTSTADEAVVNSHFDIFKIQGNAVTKIYGNQKSNSKGIL